MKYWWKWPARAAKAHIFAEDSARALCCGWLYTGPGESEVDPLQRERGPDDCGACFKKYQKLMKEQST